jgi:acetyl esterase/lipase
MESFGPPDVPTLELWPKGNPDGWTRTDKEVWEKTDIEIVKNVSKPALLLFPAPNPRPDAPFVLIFPGGGYWLQAIQHEGWDIATKLNEAGISCAVLKYRLPNREVDQPLHKAPLQDAQRAVRMLRARSASLGFDPHRLAVLGFSAGGHLAAVTSLSQASTYSAVDADDDQSYRPNYTVLIYPAYLSDQQEARLHPDLKVSADTPPAFILQTADDYDLAPSALAYAHALQRAKIPVELHLYPKGGHGYGLRTSEAGLSEWPKLLIAWLLRQR